MDKVYLIGEVGPNHNGSVETALTMIEKMAEAGVDCVKFQMTDPICSIVMILSRLLIRRRMTKQRVFAKCL